MGRNVKPIEDYQATYQAFSKDFLETLAEKVAENVDAFLMSYGTPKEYREVRYFGSLMVDSLVLWLTTEGFVNLDLAYVASEEEVAARPKPREDTDPNTEEVTPITRLPGAYL